MNVLVSNTTQEYTHALQPLGTTRPRFQPDRSTTTQTHHLSWIAHGPLPKSPSRSCTLSGISLALLGIGAAEAHHDRSAHFEVPPSSKDRSVNSQRLVPSWTPESTSSLSCATRGSIGCSSTIQRVHLTSKPVRGVLPHVLGGISELFWKSFRGGTVKHRTATGIHAQSLGWDSSLCCPRRAGDIAAIQNESVRVSDLWVRAGVNCFVTGETFGVSVRLA